MKARVLPRAAVRRSVVMDPPTPFKRLGPISRLKDFITPTEDVHVLAHLGVARVDPEQWQLRIDGMVERPLVFDLEELLRFPARELSAVFECYGNPLEPDVAARSVANVSWRGVSLADLLARITLAGARPEGLFTTRLYNRRVEHTGREHVEPAQELDVNAVIVRPADQDRVPPGRHLVTGWAWSASGITRVEVSTDGGASWHESHVVARGPAPTWQRFGFEWEAAAPGSYEIRARATDSRGWVQPNRARNAVHAIGVTIVQ